jgi:hypothetical protein
MPLPIPSDRTVHHPYSKNGTKSVTESANINDSSTPTSSNPSPSTSKSAASSSQYTGFIVKAMNVLQFAENLNGHQVNVGMAIFFGVLLFGTIAFLW